MKTKWIKLHPGTTTILKGWNQSAQGCVERTTLGLPPRTPTTLKGLHQSVRPVPVLVSSCTKWINFTCIVLVTFGSTAIATTNDLSAALQRGLFEEEANHNLDAAIQAYQSVINQYDKDRKLAATAIFRLAESYRKQGKTNEAAVQYGRIVREFTEEADLFIPSRDTLATLVKVPQPVRIAEASPTPSTSAEAEEIKRIQAMIKDSPDLINAKDTTTSQTPLHQAAQKGELIVARFLLDSGADVNAVDSVSTQGWTPLHYAAANGHKAMVELLLSRKADVHATDRRRAATALHLAAEKGFKSVAETLLDHGADISAKAGGRTPLFDAVAYGNAAVAELLISRGADPNAGAVLHVVARNGSKALAELLIANKANVNATNEVGETPLHVTAESGQVEIAMLLLSHGAEVEAKSARPDRGGWTPLQYAVAFQKLEMIRLLLENKADSNTRFDFNANLQGFTALMAAALFHNAETVDLLLSLTADPNLKSRDGMTALIAAFPDSGMDELGKKVVNMLLNHGADARSRFTR